MAHWRYGLAPCTMHDASPVYEAFVVTCLCDGRAECRDPPRARHRVHRGMRPPGPIALPLNLPATSNTRTTSGTTPAMRSATWSTRAPRQARHGSTLTWGMYRRHPAPSVRLLLKMLESCDNRAGGKAEGGSPLRPEAPALLASMGAYLFRLAVLQEVLGEDTQRQSIHDLGRAILPGIIGWYRVAAFPFVEGIGSAPTYWRDGAPSTRIGRPT
jgi:hypothetical protein